MTNFFQKSKVQMKKNNPLLFKAWETAIKSGLCNAQLFKRLASFFLLSKFHTRNFSKWSNLKLRNRHKLKN